MVHYIQGIVTFRSAFFLYVFANYTTDTPEERSQEREIRFE